MKACLASKTPNSNPHLLFHAHMVWVWACSQLWDWSARLLPNCSAILITLCLKLSVTVSPPPTKSITGAAPVLSVAANSTHTRKTASRGHSSQLSLSEKPTKSFFTLVFRRESNRRGVMNWESQQTFRYHTGIARCREKGLLYNPIHQRRTWNPEVKLQQQLARASMSLTMKL